MHVHEVIVYLCICVSVYLCICVFVHMCICVFVYLLPSAAAQVCQYADVKCGGFVALSDKGYLQVDVRNTGYIASSYYVTVRACCVFS